MQSLNLIWEKTIFYLQESIAKVYYDTWIKDLIPLCVKDNIYYFKTPGNIHTRMLNNSLYTEFYQAFIRAYRETLGEPSEDLDIIFVGPQDAAALLNDLKYDTASEAISGYYNEDIILNPEYTFKTFVVGESNKFADAAAHSVAENPGYAINPLFLYGGVGLGKTHLMHAIGNEIKKNNPDANVVYVTSESFMNQLIAMIMEANNKDMRTEFQKKYRGADVLMIDDIQFIENSDKTQNELFHTFNMLKDANKQVIFSSDRPPQKLTKLEERLRSRMEWGGPVDINPPDFETRIAILMTKINSIMEKEGVLNLEVSDEVYRYIAEQPNTTNIRSLEGALERVVMYAKIKNAGVIDLNLAKEALFNYFSSAEKKPPTVELITEAVCRYYNVSQSDILGKKRDQNLTKPRHVAMYLTREIIEMQYKKIGEYFKRDHTSVMNGVKNVERQLKTDEELRDQIKNLTAKIKGL